MDPELTISDDRLRAILHVPAGMRMDLHRVKQMVVEQGIRVGLRGDRLAALATVASEDREVAIAVGKPAQSPRYWRLRPECQAEGSTLVSGQVLADLVIDEERPLVNGLAVDGSVLPAQAEQAKEVIIGSGLEVKGEQLQVNRDGVLQVVDGLVWRVADDPRGTPKRDAILFLSDDDHMAWVRLEPGEFIPPEILQQLLVDKEITYGLQSEALARVTQGGLDKAETIEVARGVYAENGVDGAVEYLIDDRVHYEVRDDGTLDFRAAYPIQEVDKGQSLVRISPPTAGSPGMTVRGKRLDPKPGRGKDPSRFCGEGCRTQGDGSQESEVLAERAGVYNRLVSGKVQVREQVVIDGDVDMKSGNVESEFPIRIMGDIKTGFTVKSQCDIVVEGSIEDARVSAQGNLQVKGGILPGQNRVKAHGDIQTRFIEGRHIKARSVLVQGSIRHCTVYATGEIVAQEILGGHLVAGQDIMVKEAGDAQEQRTVLQAGVDPMQQAQFDEAVAAKKELLPRSVRQADAVKAASNHANNLARKASHLATQAVSPKHLKRVAEEGREALEEARRLRTEYEALMAQLEKVEQDIASYENASSKSAKCTVRVATTSYPGVEIRIGRHARKRLTSPGGAAIFRVEEGVIVS